MGFVVTLFINSNRKCKAREAHWFENADELNLDIGRLSEIYSMMR